VCERTDLCECRPAGCSLEKSLTWKRKQTPGDTEAGEAAEAGEGLADISFDLQILLYPPIVYIHPHSLISASH